MNLTTSLKSSSEIYTEIVEFDAFLDAAAAFTIDSALKDALKAKQAGCTLLLGSHGTGKAGVEDLDFQINYLKTMKEIAAKADNADDFTNQMNAAYPDCKGEDDLKRRVS